MTIKEIITAEKRSWIEGYSVSDMLDRIEAGVTKHIAELEARLENAELEKATAEEAEALSRFRAERTTVKIVPTTVRTEWYGRMW